jgi:hypothetical protein
MRNVVILILSALLVLPAFAANPRDWQSGTLLETEQEKVPSGTTKHTSTDVNAKDKGDSTKYSGNSTSTTTQEYDTFQIYKIEGGGKIYTVRQRLLFPWSKAANVSVGEKLKYAVEKNTLYLLDDDGKEFKTGVKKVKMKAAE